MLKQISTMLTVAAIIGLLPGLAQAADPATFGWQPQEEINGLLAVEKIRQVESPLGGIDYYIGEGNYIGRSLSDSPIGASFYGPSGAKLGYSRKNSVGGLDYFSNLGNKLGHSRLTPAGGYEFLDKLGLPIGLSFEGPIGFYHFFLKKSYSRGVFAQEQKIGSAGVPVRFPLFGMSRLNR